MMQKLKTLAVGLTVILIIVVGYFVYDSIRPRTYEEMLAEIIHDEDRRQLTEQLTTYVGDVSPLLRQRAALAIGRIGDDKSAGILFGMLADTSIEVATTAAFAIGLTGDKDYAIKLMDEAWDMPVAVAIEAIESAGRLADSSMVDVADQLVKFLEHPSPEVRESACYALFYADAKSKADELIAITPGEPEPSVQKAALFALARMRIAEATNVYRSFLADADPWARSLAVRGLARSTADDATQLLAMALNDKDNRVVTQAIAALTSRAKDKTVAGRLAGKLESETDEKLVVQLIGALQRLESPKSISRVQALLQPGVSDNVLAAGVTYLATVQKEGSLRIVDSVLSATQPPSVRAACVEAYALTKHDGVMSRLGERFGDEDPMVRVQAFVALTEMDSANVDFYIDKALNDPDYVLGAMALNAIGEGKRTQYLPVMRTMLSRGEMIDVDLRRSILDALDAFVQKSDNDSTVMGILMDGMLDREYVVRRQAAGIYKEKLGRDRAELIPPAQTTLKESDIVDGIKKYKSNPYAIIRTSRGEIELELLFDAAPLTVLNFIKHAGEGFYNGLIFHRVVPDFVIQGGDPRGDGWGGPPDYMRCEYSTEPYLRGTAGIATSGKDTGGSQFFITHSPQPHLNARYTVFGNVMYGMDVVDQIVRGDVIQSIVIKESAK